MGKHGSGWTSVFVRGPYRVILPKFCGGWIYVFNMLCLLLEMARGFVFGMIIVW
jgi:hypothetical protein